MDFLDLGMFGARHYVCGGTEYVPKTRPGYFIYPRVRMYYGLGWAGWCFTNTKRKKRQT